MRTLGDKGLLEGVRFAYWHGEDRAVQSAIRVAILNRERIGFRAEQTQESAAPVRREHCERSERPSKHTLAVIVSDDILDGMNGHTNLCPGGGKLKAPVFERQIPTCICFHAHQTGDLHSLVTRSRDLIPQVAAELESDDSGTDF